MSTARVNNMDLVAPPVVHTIEKRSLLVGVVFAMLSAIGAFVSTAEQFLHSYLVAYMFWIGMSLGSMAILMLQHLTGGNWAVVIRRPLGSAMRTFPLMLVLFIPIALAAFTHHLYAWNMPDRMAHDKHLQELTHAYLSPAGFVGRALVYFLIWGVLIYLLSRWGAALDDPPRREPGLRFRRLSAPGLAFYCLVISFAAIDWVMSLDPGWVSTIYPMIFIVGQVLVALCFVVVVEAILSRYKPMSELIRPGYLNDHGNLILAFIMLWAYFSFSQLLVIWSGNLPDEIGWYLRRWSGNWQYVGLGLAAFHFAVPFSLLLSRERKRHVRRLVWVAVLVMFMRYVDLFWFIEPHNHKRLFLHWLDIVIPVAMGGLWLAYFFRNLKRRPLLPLFDFRTQTVLESAHE